MAKKRNTSRYRKRKGLFVFECVVLAVLVLVLGGSIWATMKFSLINFEKLDQDKVFTSDEVNQNQIQTGNGQEMENTENDFGLSGVEMFALVGLDTRDGLEDEVKNSDTMIVACLNHNEKTIRLVSVYRDTYMNVGEDFEGDILYSKANCAYAIGGAAQFLSMLNLNLDLNITEFATVRFLALAKTIELMGGIDLDMTREEVIHLNNYNVETSEACNMPYEELQMPGPEEFDGERTMTFHVNGTQAVSYARIRYTQGNDFRRAARQRLVLQKTLEKAKTCGIGTLNSILNEVLPDVTTNMDMSKIMTYAAAVLSYNIVDQAGFPFDHIADDGELTGNDNVVPVTLESNVVKLHEFLLPGVPYEPSATVREYSDYIIYRTGLGLEYVPENSENGAIPVWTPEAQAAEQVQTETVQDMAEGYDSDSYAEEYGYDPYAE
ncbi:MAG: LCP family protein [Lachnospiraceae bacterium]|nr:LCP family protein [Lachnospiraceae bacterium]